MPAMYQTALAADYVSPSDKKAFESNLPTLPKEDDMQEKTAYLSALRSSIVDMQGNVNTFLTVKMEGDKAAESGKSKAKDEKAEETYGEEGGEEDA